MPYRGSRLTLFLKDCFEHEGDSNTRTVVFAAVSPLASDHAHSVNTLRYADRIKERKGKATGGNNARDPAKWGKRAVARWLDEHCCAERKEHWSNVTGKKLCFMHEGEMAMRCPRHAAALYKELSRLRKAAKSGGERKVAGRGGADGAGSGPTGGAPPRKRWVPPPWDDGRRSSTGGSSRSLTTRSTTTRGSASHRSVASPSGGVRR